MDLEWVLYLKVGVSHGAYATQTVISFRLGPRPREGEDLTLTAEVGS